jgi:hypothetical protein
MNRRWLSRCFGDGNNSQKSLIYSHLPSARLVCKLFHTVAMRRDGL